MWVSANADLKDLSDGRDYDQATHNRCDFITRSIVCQGNPNRFWIRSRFETTEIPIFMALYGSLWDEVINRIGINSKLKILPLGFLRKNSKLTLSLIL